MGVFSWDDKYLIGHDAIDRQHQRLFEILNNLHAAMKARHGDASIDATLAALLDYAQSHFAEEEQVMADVGYPELEAHRGKHRQLNLKLAAMTESRQAGERIATFELLTFLGEWIVDHVGRVDHEIGKHLHPPA